MNLGLADDLGWMGSVRGPAQGYHLVSCGLPPVAQLVHAALDDDRPGGGDWAAYGRLSRIYPGWRALAEAGVPGVEAAMSGIRFPDRRAALLNRALRTIARSHPTFDLRFLPGWPVARALGWLEGLPGIGRRVAATTLNFSTLSMPAFVEDGNILRLFRRFGTVDERAGAVEAYDAVMGALPAWGATDLMELHVLLKGLARNFCHAVRPGCDGCPLVGRCRRIGV